jgi:hypothetical protein
MRRISAWILVAGLAAVLSGCTDYDKVSIKHADKPVPPTGEKQEKGEKK